MFSEIYRSLIEAIETVETTEMGRQTQIAQTLVVKGTSSAPPLAQSVHS